MQQSPAAKTAKQQKRNAASILATLCWASQIGVRGTDLMAMVRNDEPKPCDVRPPEPLPVCLTPDKQKQPITMMMMTETADAK